MRSTITILISWLAAVFGILLVAFVAVRPELFADGMFFSYDEINGVLTLFGETFLVPVTAVEAVRSLPERCAAFYGGFMTDAVKGLFAAYGDAVKDFFGRMASVL